MEFKANPFEFHNSKGNPFELWNLKRILLNSIIQKEILLNYGIQSKSFEIPYYKSWGMKFLKAKKYVFSMIFSRV